MKCTVVLYAFTIFVVEAEQYYYATKYIDVPLDHFAYTTNTTFKLRYLINDSYHVERGPIFFYTGNEGDIEVFAQNTGFVNDIAPEFSALIVFAEHRYYGESLPFGNKSLSSPEYSGYLTADQAMEDYVCLIDQLQKQYGQNAKLPVIAFGGSYGGMLSAWIRMKYPASVLGAIASSAPIWQFPGLIPCDNYFRITTNVYSIFGGSTCVDNIARSWKDVRRITKDDAGKANVTAKWKLCDPLKTSEDVDMLLNYLSDIMGLMAMVNYPYPTNFIAPLPPYPVREFCNRLNKTYKTDKDMLEAFAAALTVYANYTGAAKCIDIKSSSGNLGVDGWNFQSCTEMVMPMCSKEDDMFETKDWDFKQFSDDCFRTYQVRPRSLDIAILKYGGKDIKSASNIVFSNGLYDPWSSGGVLTDISSTVLVVIIPDGAHHVELRGHNDADKSSTVAARNFHKTQIRKWLKDYYLYNFINPPSVSDI